MPCQPTNDSFSVTMHVVTLKDAVDRCASIDDAFDSVWKEAISMYAGDSLARFFPAFYKGYTVGALRISLLNFLVNEAILGLQILAMQLDQCIWGDGWVFYLLETRLGETFEQIHKDFPKEGLNSDEEGYEPIGDVPGLLRRSREKLRQARDQVIMVINRIDSSRERTPGFQIFDISDGSRVVDADWERLWHEQSLMQADDREGPRKVILRASQSEPAGLGEGYISWTASKGPSHLVGFSTLLSSVEEEGRVEGGEA